MGQRSAVLAGDGLDCTFMNHEFKTKPWQRNTWHSKATAPSTRSRASATSRATERARSSNTSRPEPSVFKLAEVRRNLKEQAVLATGVHNAASVLGRDRKEETGFVSLPKVPILVTARANPSVAASSSKVDRVKTAIPSQRSPKNGFPANETTLKRKPADFFADNRRIDFNDSKREKSTAIGRRSGPTFHQIVLPFQSSSSSRRAQVKVQADNPTRQRVRGVEHPRTARAMTADGKSSAMNKRDVSVELAGGSPTNKTGGGNVVRRARTSEGGKKPAQPTKNSSPRTTGRKQSPNKYMQPERGIMSVGSQSARYLSMEKIWSEHEKSNVKMDLKTIVARLHAEHMKMESQACHRTVDNLHEIANSDGTSEQQATARGSDTYHQSNTIKPPKLNLGACQIAIAPSGSLKNAHEYQPMARAGYSKQETSKTRIPKLNLRTGQRHVAPEGSSGKAQVQQAATRDEDVLQHSSRIRLPKVDSGSCQSFAIDVGSLNGFNEHQAMASGAGLQQNDKSRPLKDAISTRTDVVAVGSSDEIYKQQEQSSRTRPLKITRGTFDTSSTPPELVETKSGKVLENAEASASCQFQQLAISHAKLSNQPTLVEEKELQAPLGRALKLKLVEGSLPLNSLSLRTRETKAIACPICGHPVEDIVHFLIKCVGYRSARDALFQKLAELVPKGLFEEFSMLKSAAKASALVSNVFWGSYSDEVDIFVRGFLEKIWKVRDCIANFMVEGLRGNSAEFVQTSRTSRAVATEEGPRVVLTERGAMRSPLKPSATRVADTGEKSDATKPGAATIGASAASEKGGALVLNQCGHLTKYEQREILLYTEIYFLGLESQKIQASCSPGESNFGYDDERGDYHVMEHDQLAYRYEVLGILGKGSFGQVLKCNDHKFKVLRAVKMIRNKRRFHQQALVEVKILEHLRDKAVEEPGNTNTITIYESFQFRGHLCITFPLHDISLYELMKRNNFQGLNLGLVKTFASQLLETLRFLRKLHIIHSDLKPENILLQQCTLSKIKVIDFGSSCFAHEKIYTYIQSRFYRSPEVILGLPYDTMIDIWSLGCILAELFSGHPLFPGEDEVEQLACIMEVLGPPPNSVLENATRKKIFFDIDNTPRIIPNSRGRKRWPGTRNLGIAIGCNDMVFVSFLEACLRWDKRLRLHPEELMQHPWMVGVSVF